MARREELLLIDVQPEMFDAPGEPPIFGGERLLERTKDLIEEASEAEAPVDDVRHCDELGDPLEEGTGRWEIHPCIAPRDGDVIVKQHRPDSFLDTALRKEQVSRNIEEQVLARIQTGHGVDPARRQYEVTSAEDAHGAWESDDLSAAQSIANRNEVLGAPFATTVSADEVRFEEAATR